MDKFAVYEAGTGACAGELTALPEALYTRFEVRCRLPEPGLWCAWAVGESGELRLGVVEPEGGEAVLSRRFSRRLTAPAGRLRHGELRRVDPPEAWRPLEDPAALFRAAWLVERLRQTPELLVRRSGGCRLVSAPYDPRRPFPLTDLFCFARVTAMPGGRRAVFAFDEGELPVVPEEEFFEKN